MYTILSSYLFIRYFVSQRVTNNCSQHKHLDSLVDLFSMIRIWFHGNMLWLVARRTYRFSLCSPPPYFFKIHHSINQIPLQLLNQRTLKNVKWRYGQNVQNLYDYNRLKFPYTHCFLTDLLLFRSTVKCRNIWNLLLLLLIIILIIIGNNYNKCMLSSRKETANVK